MSEILEDNNINNQIRFVSHELRNHLSICDMYSQIIKKNLENSGIENSSIVNALSCIQKSVQIMNANILELKSINLNNPKILDFAGLVNKGIDLSRAYVQDKQIDFDVLIKKTCFVFADENRILSCIVNIVKNGIESIDIRGKIQVVADVTDDFAVLKISNNGKPIPKSKQDKIFEKGFTTKDTGTGFGLCICSNYLKSQNGVLKLNKSDRAKTEFEIDIPIHSLC